MAPRIIEFRPYRATFCCVLRVGFLFAKTRQESHATTFSTRSLTTKTYEQANSDCLSWQYASFCYRRTMSQQGTAAKRT